MSRACRAGCARGWNRMVVLSFEEPYAEDWEDVPESIRILLNYNKCARSINPLKHFNMFCGGLWKPRTRRTDEESVVQMTDELDTSNATMPTNVAVGSAATLQPSGHSAVTLPIPATADGASDFQVPTARPQRALWMRLIILLFWSIVISLAYTAASYWTQYNNLGPLKQNPYVIWPGIYLAVLILGGPIMLPLMIILDCFMYVYVYQNKIGPVAVVIPYYVVKGLLMLAETAILRLRVDFRFITWASFIWLGLIVSIFHCLIGVASFITVLVVQHQLVENSWILHAFSDLTGLVTIGPVILMGVGWCAHRHRVGFRRPTIQVIVRFCYYFLLVCILWLAAFAFAGTQTTATYFLHFVPVVYMASIYGRVGGALSAAISTVILVGVLQVSNKIALIPGVSITNYELFVIVLAGLGLIVGIIVDIERRKERELRDASNLLARRNAELEAAVLETKRLEQMKARFLDDISHEVRTPLHGMLGYLTLLQASPLTPAQHRWVATMRGSAGLLVSIVDDLLDISKVSSGRPLAIRPVTFQLAGAIEEALSLTAGMKILHQVELMSVVVPDLAVFVVADRQNLQRVILNLLSNALKFTQQGSVILSADVEEETNTELKVRIMVGDTGVGITPEDQAKLFQRFTQVGTTGPGQMKGTGLGLAISKELVENTMRGKIGCESKFNSGTTFWFSAIFSRASDASPPPLSGTYMTRCPSISDLQCVAGNVRGVVVHWAPKVREALHHVFRTLGCACAAVSNLDEASDQIAEMSRRGTTGSGAQPTPFVVLVDSVFDAADVVLFCMRTHPSDGAPAHVVVTTNSPETLDEQLRPGAGFVHEVLRKALSFGSIALLLRSIVLKIPFEEYVTTPSPQGGSVVSADAADAPVESFAGVRVLVADDNPVNRELAHELLLNVGVAEEDILMANDGSETIRVWEQSLNDKRGRVSLILMDCMMPIMDGFDASRRIREKESNKGSSNGHSRKDERGVPIVAVTAYSEESCRDRYVSAGMDDFLSKPFSEDALRQCVRRWTIAPPPTTGRCSRSSSDLDDDTPKGSTAVLAVGKGGMRQRVVSGLIQGTGANNGAVGNPAGGGGGGGGGGGESSKRDDETSNDRRSETRGEGTRLMPPVPEANGHAH